MDALEQLAEIARLVETRPELIREARAQKKTWEQIAQAAGLSRAWVTRLAKES